MLDKGPLSFPKRPLSAFWRGLDSLFSQKTKRSCLALIDKLITHLGKQGGLGGLMSEGVDLPADCWSYAKGFLWVKIFNYAFKN